MVEPPAAVLGTADRTDVDEGADELLEEERIALRGREQPPFELRRDSARPDERGQQLGIGIAKRAEGDLADEVRELAGRMLAERPGGVVALRPQREHEQNGRLLGEDEELLQQRDGRRVRPVQVFDRDDERAGVREACNELADDLERAPLECLGRELGGAGRRIRLEREIEQRPEIGVELVPSVGEQLLEPPAEPDPDTQLRLIRSGADPPGPEQVAERPVGKRLAV